MATANSMEGLRSPAGLAKKVTGWYIAAAVLFIVLGIFGIVEPGVAGLGVTLLVGWLLAIGAVFHFIAAFKGGGAKQVIFQVLIGIVYAIGAFYFLTHTIMATSTLTLLLAGIILAEGVIEVISYFRMKGEGASGWLLLNGIITLALGALIWFHWPSSTVWAIGNDRGNQFADDRNYAADVRSRGAQACRIRGEVNNCDEKFRLVGVENRRVVFPVDLFQLFRGNRLLHGDAQDELIVLGEGFAAVGEDDVEADERGVAGERINFVGIGKSGERFIPVGVVQRVAIFRGDSVSA